MAAPYAIEDDPWSAPAASRHGPTLSNGQQRPLTWTHDDRNGSLHNHTKSTSSRFARAASDDSLTPAMTLHLPPLYGEVYDLCHSSTQQGEESDISLAQLHRVVQAADLSASQVESIITLACPPASHAASAHCSRDELFVALALVAQAQNGQDLQLSRAKADLASEDVAQIPVPSIDLSRIKASAAARVGAAGDGVKLSEDVDTSALGADPWTSSSQGNKSRAIEGLPGTSDPPSLLQGSSIRGGWDAGAVASGSRGKRSAKAPARPPAPSRSSVYLDPGPTAVHLLPELGGFLFFRHVLYLVRTPLSPAVKRRYSDFVDLNDYLLARFPFRLIPPLPPKRLALPHVNRTQPTSAGQQDAFLEQRRLALARYARGVISHPVLSQDDTVIAFFSNGSPSIERQENEPGMNASTWKGIGNKADIVEEGLDESWRLSDAEVMHVPVDMEVKLAKTREMAGTIMDRWNGAVAVFERHVKRTEASAADSTRFSLALSSLLEAEAQTYQGSTDDSLDESSGSRVAGIPKGSHRFARSTSLLVSNSQDYADLSTARFHALQRTLDALKNGRDVWVSVRELFRRHEKLSKDPIADLEARIVNLRNRWKQVLQEKKPGYVDVCANLQNDIELDQKLIERYQRRNQRVRVAIWHEIARLQELKNHIAADWHTFARNEAVNLAATKQAAEELSSALEII